MAEKTKTAEEIYELLKNRIVRLDYQPGLVLNEADVANEFNLSRTPVRKIFEQLRNKKLLNIIPRYGAQVAPIDFRYMKSVFEVVREVEGYATKLATERMSEENIHKLERIVGEIKNFDIEKEYKNIIMADEEFHETVFKSCGNPCLVDILSDLHMHTERLWVYSQHELTDLNLFYTTLSKIAFAISERDTVKAEAAAKEHIDIFVSLIKRELL